MALKGNKHGIKLKDPNIRQEAFLQYCEWIADGKPRKAWCFEHPKYSCTWETMEKYVEQNPDEFAPIKKKIAHCKGYAKWFDKGERMAEGQKKDGNPAIYQMIMRNMYDWDKQSSDKDESQEPMVKKLANLWRNNYE